MTESTSEQPDDLDQAERQVDQDLSRFETALEHLEEKVKESRRKARDSLERARRPLRSTGSRLSRYFGTGKIVAKGIAATPKPLLLGAGAAGAAIFLFRALKKRRT